MRKQYRTTSICLAAVLLALSACSQAPSDGGSSAETTGTQAETTAAAETETAGTTAAAETETTGASAAETEGTGTTAAAEAEGGGTAAADTEEDEADDLAAAAEFSRRQNRPPEDPYDYTDPAFFNEDDWADRANIAKLKGVMEDGSYFNIVSDVKGYGVLQGSCTDGTYAYLLLANKRAGLNNPDLPAVAMVLIYKVDMSTWEIADVSEPLPLDHGASAAYNSKTGQIVVSNGRPNNGRISFVDPETLTLIEQRQLEWDVNAMAYNEKRDQYAVRLHAGQDHFLITDSDFNVISAHEGVDTGLSPQEIDCDDDYIYILNTGISKNPGVELVTVYDWDGNYVSCYREDSALESEGIFHVGDTKYAAFYNGKKSGGRVYEVEFDPKYLTYDGNGK